MKTLQPQSRASPSAGINIAHRVMQDVLTAYLPTGGPAVARAEIEKAKEVLKIYDGWKDAYNEAMASIREREKEERLEHDRHLMSLMGMGMTQQAAQQPKQLNKKGELKQEQIRRALERLMEEKTATGEKLFNQQTHWQAVFRTLVDYRVCKITDIKWFVSYVDDLKLARVNKPCTHQTVKNISQTEYAEPVEKWHFDPDIPGDRLSFDRMKAVALRFAELLEEAAD